MDLPSIGARLENGGVSFRVWAPGHAAVELVLFASRDAESASLPMRAQPDGFFVAHVPGARAGTLYKFRVDGRGPFPDPASRSQPHGVHGPSAVDDPAGFAWSDRAWRGVALEDLVIYEVHVGAATPAGTFDALIVHLAELRALGVTALELMPVASFPGERNWGYDGVDLMAPAAVYGGPDGLRRLVDAAHREGLAVLIDAVYNHFGPAGNYLREFAAGYFTDRHKTPWGDALALEDDAVRPVRELLASSAACWVRDYHADGLRLDATHALVDERSPKHILTELAEHARAAAPSRTVVVIAEDERNEARLVAPAARGGLGLDGVWADDFHHQMRRAFAGDREGYFGDYTGSAQDLAATLRKGWFYEGQRSAHLGRARGTPADAIEPARLVHCIQNHDQVGNRALGDRLGACVAPAAYRAMSALLLLSPYTPLLFMGQEWNAQTPFLYFTDHEPELGRLVTEGRRAEFKSFRAFEGREIPDPQARATFEASKLDRSEREREPHRGTLELYRALLALRPRLARTRDAFDVRAVGPNAVCLERRDPNGARLHVLVNLRGAVEQPLDGARVVLFTEDPAFGGATPAREAHRGGALAWDGPGAAVFVHAS